MGIIVVISPIAISFYDFGWGDLSTVIIAMMWQVNYASRGHDFRFDPYSLLASLPFTFLRIVFAIMMMRLYQEKTTRKRTLVVGIASELQLITIFYVPMLIMMLISPSMMGFYMIIIPIPILLVTGILIMKFKPPIEGLMWIEEEKTQSWWEKQDEEPTTTTEQSKDTSKKPKEPESPW